MYCSHIAWNCSCSDSSSCSTTASRLYPFMSNSVRCRRASTYTSYSLRKELCAGLNFINFTMSASLSSGPGSLPLYSIFLRRRSWKLTCRKWTASSYSNSLRKKLTKSYSCSLSRAFATLSSLIILSSLTLTGNLSSTNAYTRSKMLLGAMSCLLVVEGSCFFADAKLPTDII